MRPYWSDGQATIWHANALALPLPDASVDLIVTSPPYFGLRSYQDGCATCAATGKASMRGYMERYCPGCGKVGTVNKCPKCDRTTLRTEATKAAIRADATPCPDCDGKGTGHYSGQLGSEATPAEFVDALIAATREMVRVLKPSGSIWVNLGDKYAGGIPGGHKGGTIKASDYSDHDGQYRRSTTGMGIQTKSLIGIPWRYALRCIDDLGLILRAEVIWSKPNGLPESVTDRVRRSHEQWFHFTLEPRYYSAVDEVREEHAGPILSSGVKNPRYGRAGGMMPAESRGELIGSAEDRTRAHGRDPAVRGVNYATASNPLGKLPGSVWTIPTQPLRVPDHLGIDHFAAFPMEFPRRIVRGWSPRDVCTACGEGRRPVVDRPGGSWHDHDADGQGHNQDGRARKQRYLERVANGQVRKLTGDRECACPDTTAPTTPGIVLDPFGGTGTTALVAVAEGRTAHHVDLSGDYCRLAQWRITDPGERARAREVEKPPVEIEGQADLFDLEGIA